MLFVCRVYPYKLGVALCHSHVPLALYVTSCFSMCFFDTQLEYSLLHAILVRLWQPTLLDVHKYRNYYACHCVNVPVVDSCFREFVFQKLHNCHGRLGGNSSCHYTSSWSLPSSSPYHVQHTLRTEDQLPILDRDKDECPLKNGDILNSLQANSHTLLCVQET